VIAGILVAFGMPRFQRLPQFNRPMPPSCRRIGQLLVMVGLLVVAGCSAGDSEGLNDSGNIEAGGTDPDQSEEADEGSEDQDSQPASTVAEPDDDLPDAEEPDDSADVPLAGEEFDGFANEGDQLLVVAVAHDDTLNVRAGPGVDSNVVDIVETSTVVVASGSARLLPQSLWYEITTPDDVSGWVNSKFVAFEGVTNDATSLILERAGGSMSADSIEELGEMVVADYVDPDIPALVALVEPAASADLDTIMIDVIGLGDDALAGVRLHIFGQVEGGTVSLKSVEETALCLRGVTAESLCL